MTTRIDTEIAQLERRLRADDPAFVRQCDRIVRRAAVRCLAVFALLAATAVLFTAGLAFGSPLPWLGGLAAFSLAYLVDDVLAPH
jgi:uncharacterized membrane protein YbhN (UPF0104 family)